MPRHPALLGTLPTPGKHSPRTSYTDSRVAGPEANRLYPLFFLLSPKGPCIVDLIIPLQQT